MFDNFEPRHWIATLILLAGFYLLSQGVDSYVTAMLTLVIGYFFGREKEKVLKK